MYNPTNFEYIRDIGISNCKTSLLASSSTASKSNFNLLSHSTIPKPQTLEILLVKPMFMPEIHSKDGFQRWKMRGEHPKHKGKCSERISPDWIQSLTIMLQDTCQLHSHGFSLQCYHSSRARIIDNMYYT